MKILPQMRHARKYLDLLISNVKKLSNEYKFTFVFASY